jgi:outer membrane protein assembly factor BamB
VFIGSCNGLVRRLDRETGAVRWETNVRGKATGRYNFHGDVFIAPDRIVVTADVPPGPNAEAGVHALDLQSGREVWREPIGRGVAGAVTGAARRVFVYTIPGDLLALDLASGRREWSFAMKASAWESPAAAGSRVFGGSADGLVYALNDETGRPEWEQRLGAPVSTSIRVGDSGVYAGTSDGVMHRLDVATGRALSSVKLAGALQPAAAPLVKPDAVVVLLVDREANYRALVSIDSAATRINWRRAAPDRWTTSRVFATERTIVLGTPSGDVTAFCIADGAPAWSHKLTSGPIRSIGGGDEMLFVGTPQGTLYAVKPPRACH